MNTRRRLLRCSQRAVDIREVILIRPSITLNGDCLRSESRCAQAARMTGVVSDSVEAPSTLHRGC